MARRAGTRGEGGQGRVGFKADGFIITPGPPLSARGTTGLPPLDPRTGCGKAAFVELTTLPTYYF